MSLTNAPRRLPIGALISSWRVYIEGNGVTNLSATICSEPADTLSGYSPAHTTADGVRVILICDAPASTREDARCRLRFLLWQANHTGAIHLATDQEGA